MQSRASGLMAGVIRAVYPPQCVICGEMTEGDFGLCGACWRDSWFIGGPVCDLCGLPMVGGTEPGAEHCDDCLATPRPWAHGRAVLRYQDTGRSLVLALKHGDRPELARAAGPWLARAAASLIRAESLLVPVPLHRGRLFRRRYNQSALLARALGEVTGRSVLPDALQRVRATRTLDGRGRDARFAELSGAIRPHPRRGGAAARCGGGPCCSSTM